MTPGTPSQTALAPSAPEAYRPHIAGGMFLREIRYLAGVAAAAGIFLGFTAHTIPSPGMDGTVALSWGPAVSLTAEWAMLGALVLAMALGTLITWRDTPHAGLFIACAGLLAPAIHWGGIRPLLLMHHEAWRSVFYTLAIQCAFWALFIALGETCCRLFYYWFSRGHAWPALLGIPWPAPWSLPENKSKAADYPATGMVLMADSATYTSGKTGRNKILRYWINQGIGFLLTGLVAALVLELLLKSQDTGQVLFACFVAFLAGAYATGRAVPAASTWSIWMAVPATAAAGYLVVAAGLATAPVYPGQVPRFVLHSWPIYLARGLPIAYVAAGMAGAILGFYAALRSGYQHKLMQLAETS